MRCTDERKPLPRVEEMRWLSTAKPDLRPPAKLQAGACHKTVGANIHEANYAASKADFINKFHIALKECVETEYWIEMLVGSNAISEQISNELLQECGVIRRMLVKSITTAKGNTNGQK